MFSLFMHSLLIKKCHEFVMFKNLVFRLCSLIIPLFKLAVLVSLVKLR